MMKASRKNKPLRSATALLLFASAPALAVEPFTANYQASYMGLNGTGKKTLEPQGDDRWKYTLSIGSGAIKLDQSTTFEDRDGQWRPLSGTDSSLPLIKKTDKKTNSAWDKGVATRSGRVKPEPAGAVELAQRRAHAALTKPEQNTTRQKTTNCAQSKQVTKRTYIG